MGRLILVHAFGAAAIDDAGGVNGDAVFCAHAHGLHQVERGNTRCANAAENQLHIFEAATLNMAGID